jgi:ArsR family transcriptional regulator
VGIESSHLSQQLAILRRANIVKSRRAGSAVFYSVVDPRVFQLLEVTKAILTGALAETRDLLEELSGIDFVDTTRSPRPTKAAHPRS